MGDINLLGMIRKIKNSLSGFVSTSDKATKSKFGIVKVGDNLSVSNGTISVPVATADTYGVVKATESSGFSFDLLLDNSDGSGTGTMNFTFPSGKTITDYKYLMVIGSTGTEFATAFILTDVLNSSTACRVNASYSGGIFVVVNVKSGSVAMDSNSGSMKIYKVFGIA